MYRAKYYSDVVEWEKTEKIVKERDLEAFAAGEWQSLLPYNDYNSREVPFSIWNCVLQAANCHISQR